MKKQTKIITTILITSTVAILCAAILVAAIIHSGWLFGSSSMFSDYSSATETTIIEETIIQETSSTESTTQESPSTPQPEQPQPTVSDEKLNVKVVQLADPKTGISWDGVSPITYTYPDGTTGTEPRDGATYEQVPGVYVTYEIPRDRVGREEGSTCPLCHRIIQWLSKGMFCKQTPYSCYCNECGVYLEPYTCHTCATTPGHMFCDVCGKKEWDGTNGTCVRPLADMICDGCGKELPANVCHTCGE